ncbi:Agc protein kinase, partial [Globisporangium splendens]
MGTSQSTAAPPTRARTRSADASNPPSSSLPSPMTRASRWSATRFDQHEYSASVINVHTAAFGRHRDHDEVVDLMFRSHAEQHRRSDVSRPTELQDGEKASSAEARCNDPVRDNLVMLPSALDPLGRKIRRITTDVVDSDEQLLLVKRRASAAKAIALQGHQRSVAKDKRRDRAGSRSSSGSFHSRKKSCSAVDAPMTPDDFKYLKVIGVGAWGRVVLVRSRRDGELYAMKVISKRSVAENNLAEKILSERDVLGGTHHHSLVHLHWAFQTQNSLFLVMDYCPGGELSVHLQHAERFSEEVAIFYAAEIVLALEHLHRHGIIYRDLKPENMLLTENGHLKLVDFGISKFGITEATIGATTICGSYEYLAPEVFLNRGYGTAVDWWSFGAVLYEMLTGLPPWYSHNAQIMRKHILHKPLTFPSYVSEEARDLLRRLLCRDPAKRLGSSDGSTEIKSHAFFRNTDWQMVTFREIFPPIQPCSSPSSIENASNFDVEFTRLSIGSIDTSSCNGVYDDEFKEFDFGAPEAPVIEYGYARDIGVRTNAAGISRAEILGTTAIQQQLRCPECKSEYSQMTASLGAKYDNSLVVIKTKPNEIASHSTTEAVCLRRSSLANQVDVALIQRKIDTVFALVDHFRQEWEGESFNMVYRPLVELCRAIRCVIEYKKVSKFERMVEEFARKLTRVMDSGIAFGLVEELRVCLLQAKDQLNVGSDLSLFMRGQL